MVFFTCIPSSALVTLHVICTQNSLRYAHLSEITTLLHLVIYMEHVVSREYSVNHLPGGYRRLLQKPMDLEW